MLIKEIISESFNSSFERDRGDNSYELSYWNGRMRVYFDYGNDMWKSSLHIYFKVDDKVTMTGGGNAMKIFSTFIRSVRENLPRIVKSSTKRIYIQGLSAEASRIKLFRNRLVPMMNSEISNVLGSDWHYAGEREFSNVVEFVWSKNK